MSGVGFIGLGSMGSAIAGHLLDEGVDVTVWNRSSAAVDALVARGANRATTAQQALQLPVSFSMLANDEATLEVLAADVVATAPGATHICMASISPQAAGRLTSVFKSNQVEYVAAPVLGRPEVAAKGELNIITAGNRSVLDAVQPFFDIIGKRTWYVGDEPRRANVVKVAVNYNIIHALQAMGESIALVESQGVAGPDFAELLGNTLFEGVVHRVYGQFIAHRTYRPAGFSLELGLKDLKLVESSARESGIELPSLKLLESVFERALMTDELDGADWSAIAEVTRQQSLGAANASPEEYSE